MSTDFNIDAFKSSFQTAARQYMFKVQLVFPTALNADSETKKKSMFHVKSSSLPAKDLEENIASWQGFDYKTASKATYNDWTVSFNVDVNSKLLDTYLKWHDMILNPSDNVQKFPNQYMVNQTVELLGLDYSPIMTYTLVYACPKSIGEISLDYASSDFATFDVTYSYTYFTHAQMGSQAIPNPGT
jgi:hypothetical protein